MLRILLALMICCASAVPGLMPLAGAGRVMAQEQGMGDAPALPERLAKRLRDNPERFVETATGLILGHGSDGGIDAAGIARFIAVERAAARASALRRYLAADLDDDGTVTADEGTVIVALAAARQRGRLHLAFQRADADGNGRITPAELRGAAQAAAEAALPAAEAAQWQSLLALDSDGDGRVTLAEVKTAAQAADDTGKTARGTRAERQSPGAAMTGEARL